MCGFPQTNGEKPSSHSLSIIRHGLVDVCIQVTSCLFKDTMPSDSHLPHCQQILYTALTLPTSQAFSLLTHFLWPWRAPVFICPSLG